MPTIRRSRAVPAPPEDVWPTVGDPHHLPRWWPRVQRVENVDARAFTAVLLTDRGRPVRIDYRVLESDPPVLRRWEQEIENTPFDRVLAAAETGVRLQPHDGGTRITLQVTQRLRGLSRLGGFMVRRATRRILDEALDSLEELHGP